MVTSNARATSSMTPACRRTVVVAVEKPVAVAAVVSRRAARGRLWRWALGLGTALASGGVHGQAWQGGGMGGGAGGGGASQDALFQEIQRLRLEVEQLRSQPPQAAMHQQQQQQQQQPSLDTLYLKRELDALRGAIQGLGAGGGGVAAPMGGLQGGHLGAGVGAGVGGGVGAVLGAGLGGGLGGNPGAALGGGLGAAGMGGNLGALGAALGGGLGANPSAAMGVGGLGVQAGANLGALGGLGASIGADLSSGLSTGMSMTSDLRTPSEPDGCATNPLFASLHGALKKLALLEQDPVEASFQIHEAWEQDPTLFESCPVGIITALVYLSIAQDRDWKYQLLHKATYLLHSTPGLADKVAKGKWPMSDRLIRTMYHNSEVLGRTPLRFADAAAQPREVSRVAESGINEAAPMSLRYRDTLHVHFARVLFYHFYHDETSPCACRTRSWCLPQWLRHTTNHTVDIWIAGREEGKALYRMDAAGCIRRTATSLADHYFAEVFDLVFVFEVNALMHPHCRIVPTRRMLLYPTFDLSEPQVMNLETLGISVLADDAILKPPNPAARQLLEDALRDRMSRSQRAKDRLLLFPAEIRPMKGQLDFLQGLLVRGNKRAVQRLRGMTIVVAGGCGGNQTYCAEVVGLTRQVTEEGLINVVLADQLRDEELAQLMVSSLGLVLYSRVDCNPRAVYEGFVTDTSFFVTDRTRLPAGVQHLGHVVEWAPDKLADQLADFVEFSEAGGFGGRPREFAQRHLREADIYPQVVNWMDQKYLTGKLLEPVIRSEDALSKALNNEGGGGGIAGGLLGALARGGLGDAFQSRPASAPMRGGP
eukprot:TRINITY_DN8724_c0_g3_i1.p1 TRINITY_DN8724_c0_g3~~TRINITY_DN8724_c0_g3_i1.p1  ORF type:complete len:845 (+),score=109.33 TRINITY_DN8724_c0_g3_i1:72-2537(+)